MPEFLCGARLPGTHARCQLEPGHRGLHTATLLWPEPDPDDAPTMKLPPIRDRILPPPPPPVVRDLTDRAELLREMAAELARELGELGDDGDNNDDGDQGAELPPCRAPLVQGRRCDWSTGRTPCLAYGSEGCGMKAQEK